MRSGRTPARIEGCLARAAQAGRAGVQRDLDVLFLMLGGVSCSSARSIANVTLVSVMERVGEIGLRRALGATRRHIATQFLLESATLGLVGGLLGASIGMLVAGRRFRLPDVDARAMVRLVPNLTPLVGALVGLLAGFYPARRAALLEPVDAAGRNVMNLSVAHPERNRSPLRRSRSPSRRATRRRRSIQNGELPGVTKEFGLTEEEFTAHVEESQALIAECMAAAGFEYIPVDVKTIEAAQARDAHRPGYSAGPTRRSGGSASRPVSTTL